MKKSAAAPVSSTSSREANLNLALSSITKQFGQGSVTRLGSNTAVAVEPLSSGNIAADTMIGIGGLPKGRVVEIYGPESSGKTTLCLAFIAQAQRQGGVAAIVDVEHALDPAWAKINGVDIDNLLVSQPDNGEDALTIVETLVRSNAVDVVVLDSVAALVTKQELGGEMGDAQMGATARLMSQAMRRLTAAVSKSKCVCIFTNQIREKIGVMFGNPETTSGGRALKFFASVRIDIRRKDHIKGSDGSVIGNLVKAKCVKNKVAAPFTECEMEILYDRGICRWGALIEKAVAQKVIEKKGPWFAFNGELIGQGREAAREALRANSELFAKIDSEVRARIAQERVVLAVEEQSEGVAADPGTTEESAAPAASIPEGAEAAA